ncbi:hypothetical protein SCORR_v1c03300 [Spiroplasma corruscae]|uniref:Uncharacterized protein n=1 Tax=Spiroplasma corruscae TaxID=216934 RepID=A0A222EP70_9MOLU|nr:hypothetical protein [Spiroplasma corruscae]ASP28104.1 hypothetical protein SCORR_v1c03300 [Spiroplasma corruscae]
MKLNYEINKFNSAVKKMTFKRKDLLDFINSKYNYIKDELSKVYINFKKMGDFAYNTFTSNNKIINLDLSIVKYNFSSKITHDSIQNEFLEVIKNIDFISEIHTHKKGSYLNIILKFKNYSINFRVISILYKKYNKGRFYIINKNNENYEEIAIKLQEDFIYANKLSSGLLFSLKRLMNYILKNEFCYTYNLDMIMLRWFYEYVCKSVDDFILKNYKDNNNLNIKKFLTPSVFKKWIKNNISFLDLVYFIFVKWDSTTTYYYKLSGFLNEEMFDDISRWSQNTYSAFSLPKNYISRISIFDSNNYEDKRYMQNNLSEEDGFSEIVWSKYKNEGMKYLVTPKLRSGIPNFIMFKKWLVSKSNSLYLMLGENLQSEIKTTKTREAINELNYIANNWFTKYNQMLKYLQPFFDRKYSFFNSFKIDELVAYILNTVDKISKDDWLIKNYF